MVTYVVRRLLYAIPVLVAASFLIFTFTSLTTDPLSGLRMNRNVDPALLDKISERKHLDEPLVLQYAYWVKEASTQKFGTTVLGDRPIWPDLKRVMGNTLQLVIAAEIVAVLLAILIGVYSAIRQYSPFDYFATSFSFLGLALPTFWLALILQVIFTNIFLAFDVRIFYTASLSSVDPGSGISFLLDRAQHLALPIMVLAITAIATYSRYIRASMLEVIASDYTRTARAKGLSENKVIMKHAFRNALIPITTLIGLDFGTLFGGAVITETIFALDGMGAYFIDALNDADPYPLMAWLMVTSVMIVIGNLLADVVYGYLDPRIRYD